MSSPQLRRQDRVLGEAETREFIAQAYCGRLARSRRLSGDALSGRMCREVGARWRPKSSTRTRGGLAGSEVLRTYIPDNSNGSFRQRPSLTCRRRL